MTAAASSSADQPDGAIADAASPATATALVWWVLGRWPWRIVIGAFAGIVWMGAGALLPVVLGATLDGAVRTGSLASLLPWALVIAGVFAAQTIASVVRHHLALWLTHRSQWSLEQLVTRRVLDPRGGETATTGQTVSLATNDTAAVADIANLMCRGVGAVVTFAVVAVVMVASEWRLGLMAVIGMPLSLLALSPLWRPSRDRAATLQRQLAAVSATAADTISGLRVIKGLGGEPVARRWFADEAAAVQRAAVHASRLTSVWAACSTVVPGVILAAIIWVAGPLVLDGELSPGDLVAFTGLAAWLRNPLNTFSEAGQVWVAGLASARRITTALNTATPVDDPHTSTSVPTAASVTVDDVHDGACLTGVSFTVNDGEHVAIACADHRAAATLVELLARHRRPTRGTIIVGGIDVDQVPLDVLRGHVAVEPHHSWLYAGTIADNLALGAPDSERDDLTAALVAAAGDDMLAAPDGIDRRLGERGVGLSGGQRQRLALARRLVGNPPVVVVQDPTSALDVVTEQTVARRLRDLRAARTTILVTTSPTLLAVADRVIVVTNGRVDTTGTHHELVASNPAYRHIVGVEDEAG